ncbi:hypothetical protein VF21_05998 [Pseudogymnoascus sp. 05NY08]|nr:hypothetical protein VF21_05998 [Pseudogymnoascus sp. 05NY08]
MAKVSSNSLRVKGIPPQTDKATFIDFAKQYSSQTIARGWLSSSVSGSNNPTVSISLQSDDYVGTITLPSKAHKEAALQKNDTEWMLDDVFNGITVLSSPDEPDLDICAVHGLNGNAFDTWAAQSTTKTIMWLRDLLPTTEPFENARVMTFGYSSQLSDRQNLSGILEWSHHLLLSVSNVRKSEKERARPILFVCHSLGGLVARQAMIRLNGYDKPEYKGIQLERCGLLFLSTPHSGTTEADWNKLLLDIASVSWGVRPEIVDSLRAFNPTSSESQDQYANMKIKPPCAALYETKKTKVKGFNRHVVTRQSASFGNITASPMENVDHNTICKFDSKFNGFIELVTQLRYLRGLLMNGGNNAPPVSDELDRRNIFYVHGNDKASLEWAYIHIARRIGPEYLMKEFQGRDLQEAWRNERPEERIQRFKAWLEDEENENSLFLFDDVDGVQGVARIGETVPPEAQTVLYTTRNPVVHDPGFHFHKIRITPMDANTLIKIMETVRNEELTDSKTFGDLFQRQTLLQIAETVHGHPLAASIAIKYIVRVVSYNNPATAGQAFIDILNSDNYKEREEFLNFSPENVSIMETFHVSRRRLRDPEGQAWRLMQFHCMLDTSESGTNFFDHTCFITSAEFPDHDILSTESIQVRNRLSNQIESVSFGERIHFSKPLMFHPLWLECTRHMMGPEGRLRYARQVLQVSYHSYFSQVNHGSDEARTRAFGFLAHARHCMAVCRNFKIGFEDLDILDAIQEWVQPPPTRRRNR